MRLPILLTFLATLLPSVLAAATDTSVCRSSQRNGKNNFDIVQAINNFCGPTWDLVSTISVLVKIQHPQPATVKLTTYLFLLYRPFPAPKP